MSERAVMVTATLGGCVCVYLHEDRIEVGHVGPLFTERLSRVAYRDARRMLVWSDRRSGMRWVAVALLAAGALTLGAAAVLGFEGEGAAIASVVGVTTLLCSLPLFYSGRRGGITRFRIDGVRGHVEGTLAGRRRKRDEILARIEERIRERQRPSSDA